MARYVVVMPPSADTLASVRHLLGQAPDAEIAAQAGVTVEAVKARRRELSITPFLRPPPGSVAAPTPPATSTPASSVPSGGVVLRRKAGDTAGGARRVLEHPLERHAHLFHQGLTDAEIADSADQPVATVQAYRAAHALPAAPAPRVVEEERRPRTRVSPLEAFVDQLGKVPDEEIAARAGVSRTWVVAFRKRKGIEAFEAPSTSGPATTETAAGPRRRRSKMDAVMHLIGVRPDAEIARLAGVTPDNVRNFRRRHGIGAPGRSEPEALPAAPAIDAAPTPLVAAEPPAPAPAEAPATPESGSKTVRALPEASTADPSTGPRRRRSKMDAVVQLIGVRPDAEVARLAGVTTDNVRNFRRRHGIVATTRGESEVVPAAPAIDATPTPLVAAEPPPPPMVAPASRRKPGRKTPIDAFAHLLGTVPDAEVARLAGASVAAVSAYRARRGIPPFRDVAPRVEPEPVLPAIASAPPTAVAPAPVEAPPTPRPVQASQAASAFKVLAANEVERRVFLVVAADVVEAATLAVRGLDARADGPWQVRRIRLLGEGLR